MFLFFNKNKKTFTNKSAIISNNYYNSYKFRNN